LENRTNNKQSSLFVLGFNDEEKSFKILVPDEKQFLLGETTISSTFIEFCNFSLSLMLIQNFSTAFQSL